jgi:hypothetical protein
MVDVLWRAHPPRKVSYLHSEASVSRFEQNCGAKNKDGNMDAYQSAKPFGDLCSEYQVGGCMRS